MELGALNACAVLMRNNAVVINKVNSESLLSDHYQIR
jgi:hypothetical protein